MLSESEIHMRIARVLAGDLSIAEFADWLASASWNMHKDAGLAVQRMVGAIELALAELANGDRSNDDVRALLRSFVVSEKIDTLSASSHVFIYKVSSTPRARVIVNVSSNSLTLPPSTSQLNRHSADIKELVLADV